MTPPPRTEPAPDPPDLDPAGRPGWYVGESEVSQYQLVRRVHSGGEGVLWQATRTQDGASRPWAVKVLLAEHIDRTDDETRRQSLERWHRTWDETIERTVALRSIPGIVPVVRVLIGPVPHRFRQAPPGSPLTLYLVTPWVDGQNLAEWRRSDRRAPQEVRDVVVQLCRLVDDVAAAGLVHRDISPGNVMVGADGRVNLVDFAFMRPTGAVTRRIATEGFTAPELDIDPANDRYSVGAVVHHLLTGAAPAAGRAAPASARRQLVDRGFSPALAEHVTRLLDAEPAARPAPLSDWAGTFAQLLDAPAERATYRDLALAADAYGGTVLAGAGGGAVATGRLSPTMYPALRRDTAGPTGVAAVSAARRGNGTVALAAGTDGGELWLRPDDCWLRVDGIVAAGPVRLAGCGDGSVRAFVVDDRDRLAAVTIPLAGAATVARFDAGLRRVLAACEGPDGAPVVLAETAGGDVVSGTPGRLLDVGLCGVDAADIAGNDWGELVCVALRRADNRIAVAETIAGEWEEPRWSPAPAESADVACTGHRNGVTLAVAAASGLWVGRPDDVAGLTRRWAEPTERVVAACGPGWRVQVAAVAQPDPVLCEEAGAGSWPEAAVAVSG
ncbi:protein kinase domain-containing protein [Dactylosporangium sp. CA-139066]|uniref:protein kinase domain-containing protein n=1 Tax=Dactylosporangium sp. CA-139066 TaxID=3239930 RepID=UPI003D8C44F7